MPNDKSRARTGGLHMHVHKVKKSPIVQDAGEFIHRKRVQPSIKRVISALRRSKQVQSLEMDGEKFFFGSVGGDDKSKNVWNSELVTTAKTAQVNILAKEHL